MLLLVAIKQTEVIIPVQHQQVDSDVCREMTMTGLRMEAQLSRHFEQRTLLSRNQCTWHRPHQCQHCTSNNFTSISRKQNSA